MGGPNLEVFKFGMYIMFPIGIMYYFGTNLDSRFTTPDFWPKAEQTHRIPFERDEINEELERLKNRRLAARARRLELEKAGINTEVTANRQDEVLRPRPEILEATHLQHQSSGDQGNKSKGWLGFFR